MKKMRFRFTSRCVAAVLALGSLPALASDQSLPIPAAPSWRPLRDSRDPRLQDRLERRLNAHPLWRQLVARQRMAVGLVDLREPEAARFAAVNGDTMLYAASLPKIAVLLTSFDQIEEGGLSETPSVLKDMEDMIRRSDNQATTRMIERLGLSQIAATVTHPRYRLYDPEHGGGLWVGKAYAKGGRRSPDPLNGISHGATAVQACRFYYLLATGRLVNRDRSEQMLELLSNTELGHKFAYSLKHKGELDGVYRKSGSWQEWHSDSVLVWQGNGRRYILVALVQDRRGEQLLRELLPAAEALVTD